MSTHEVGMRSGWTKAFNEYARKVGLKDRDKNLEGTDVREGLSAVISCEFPKPAAIRRTDEGKAGNTGSAGDG